MYSRITEEVDYCPNLHPDIRLCPEITKVDIEMHSRVFERLQQCHEESSHRIVWMYSCFSENGAGESFTPPHSLPISGLNIYLLHANLHT